MSAAIQFSIGMGRHPRRQRIEAMNKLLIAAAIVVASSTIATAEVRHVLSPPDRQAVANSVLAVEPQGGPMSNGFTRGSGGITPRQAAGASGPAYLVRRPAPHRRIAR